MEKKQERKQSQPPVETKPKEVVKKSEPSQKQLKQTVKQPEIHKKLSEPVPVHKAKQSESQNHVIVQQKPKTQQNDSTQKIKQIPVQKQKETSIVSNNKPITSTEKQESKPVKQQKNENGHPLPNNQGAHSLKVPENVSISLTSVEITELLQNLMQSLPKIRDIDAQSLIRRSIKKLESKIKQAKQNGENKKTQ